MHNPVGEEASLVSQHEKACSQHTSSKIHSDSMEKCWFSVNNCIRLSFALLTWAIGCEDWKLVGRSVSLDCFQLQTFCSLHIFHKVMRHPYTTGIYNSNYSKSWVIVIVQFKLGLSYSAGNYYVHKGTKATRTKTCGSRVWRKFKSQVNHIGAAQRTYYCWCEFGV